MDGAHDVMCTVHSSGFTSIHRNIIIVIPYHLIFNALKMLQSTYAVDVANGVANNASNEVLLVS